MIFCALSYADRQFSFSEQQLQNYVSDAVAACSADAEIADVIRDFSESISIMELVGLTYEFAHRSFQEYFYAKFVISDRKLSLEEKIGWLLVKFVSDDTIEMIADMDRTYFEDDFLLPRTKALDDKLSKIDPEANPAGVLSKFFNRMHAADLPGRKDTERSLQIYYTASNTGNHFFWRQAFGKYREVRPVNSEDNIQEAKKRLKNEVGILRQEFGGEIKIHHTNNERLNRAGACRFAANIKDAISLLRQRLEAKQDKRKRGLGALILKKYASGQ